VTATPLLPSSRLAVRNVHDRRPKNAAGGELLGSSPRVLLHLPVSLPRLTYCARARFGHHHFPASKNSRLLERCLFGSLGVRHD